MNGHADRFIKCSEHFYKGDDSSIMTFHRIIYSRILWWHPYL